MKERGRTFRTGFTLMECMLAAVVLAMLTGALLMPFSVGAQSAHEDARRTLAINLGQGLMEEILAKPVRDPQGDEKAERDRRHWDDMADYDGFFEDEGEIEAFDGTAITEAAVAGMTRQASVRSFYVAGQDTDEDPDFLRIEVEVKHRGNTIVKLARLAYAND